MKVKVILFILPVVLLSACSQTPRELTSEHWRDGFLRFTDYLRQSGEHEMRYVDSQSPIDPALRPTALVWDQYTFSFPLRPVSAGDGLVFSSIEVVRYLHESDGESVVTWAIWGIWKAPVVGKKGRSMWPWLCRWTLTLEKERTVCDSSEPTEFVQRNSPYRKAVTMALVAAVINLKRPASFASAR